MRTVIRILMILVLIVLLAYGAVCVYGNFFSDKGNIEIEMQRESEARYSLVVKNTATVILTNDFEIFGDEVGSRVYLLHGYWELVGTEFRYYDSDIVLSEQIFGEIILKGR